MDNNLQWQKHHTNERVQARQKEAEWQRLLKQGSTRREPAAGKVWNWFVNLFQRRSRRRHAQRRSSAPARQQRTV